MIEMMMSVLQEIKGLTKQLHFIILSRGKSSFHANFQVHTWFTCFDISISYTVLSGLVIIIIFSRSKGVNKIIYLCTRLDGKICLHAKFQVYWS